MEELLNYYDRFGRWVKGLYPGGYKQFYKDNKNLGDFHPKKLFLFSLAHIILGFALGLFLLTGPLGVLGVIIVKEIYDGGTFWKKAIDVVMWFLGSLISFALVYWIIF